LKARQLFQGFDFFLKEASVDEGKDIEHGVSCAGQLPKV
jgi:hypothetical protein